MIKTGLVEMGGVVERNTSSQRGGGFRAMGGLWKKRRVEEKKKGQVAKKSLKRE